MDDLNPADFTALQPYLDSMRVKRGLREQVLDDASGLFPGALVLFEDNGNVCSTRHVTAVPSIHENLPPSQPRQALPPPGARRVLNFLSHDGQTTRAGQAQPLRDALVAASPLRATLLWADARAPRRGEDQTFRTGPR
jgi:hypothetical protein